MSNDGDLKQAGAILNALSKLLRDNHPDVNIGRPTRQEYSAIDRCIEATGFRQWDNQSQAMATADWYHVLAARLGKTQEHSV